MQENDQELLNFEDSGSSDDEEGDVDGDDIDEDDDVDEDFDDDEDESDSEDEGGVHKLPQKLEVWTTCSFNVHHLPDVLT